MGSESLAPVEPEVGVEGRPSASRTRGRGFFAWLRRGPWGYAVGRRLAALQELIPRVASLPHVVGVVVFGSYARAEAGASSDLDLLILFDTEAPPERLPEGRAALAACGDIEAAHRLPVHLAPLLASVRHLDGLGESLQRAILSDGIVLYGAVRHLAALVAPPPLVPMAVLAYRLGNGGARERVRLHRRLFGYTTAAGRRSPGLVHPPGRRLGPGVLLVPLTERPAVVRALQEAGTVFSEVPAWLPRDQEQQAGRER